MNYKIFFVLFYLIFLNSKLLAQQPKSMTRERYKNPVSDFVAFQMRGEKELYTGKINYQKLQESAAVALCCMGRIPSVYVTYYDKGCRSGFIQVGSSNFASDIKKITQKVRTLNNLGDYEKKRKKLLAKKNVYILDKETGYNNEYILTWYEF